MDSDASSRGISSRSSSNRGRLSMTLRGLGCRLESTRNQHRPTSRTLPSVRPSVRAVDHSSPVVNLINWIPIWRRRRRVGWLARRRYVRTAIYKRAKYQHALQGPPDRPDRLRNRSHGRGENARCRITAWLSRLSETITSSSFIVGGEAISINIFDSLLRQYQRIFFVLILNTDSYS